MRLLEAVAYAMIGGLLLMLAGAMLYVHSLAVDLGIAPEIEVILHGFLIFLFGVFLWALLKALDFDIVHRIQRRVIRTEPEVEP